MVNKFTQKAQSALEAALSFSRELGHSYIGTEHLLLGLLTQKESIASRILTLRGADEKSIKKSIIDYVGIGSVGSVGADDMTPRLRVIIENAALEAQKSRVRYVGTEHLLCALMNRCDSIAVRLLEAEGISSSEIKSDLAAYLGSAPTRQREEFGKEEDGKKSKKQNLLLYGKDLTALAADGKCDPVLCREKETERLIRILCRRGKNNPCIIGEPGVGKTAVVEGLAERIVSGNVPPELCDKRIITLDISAMIAGAKYRGEFEDRIKGVAEEVKQNPNIILFVDEMHIMVGAGAAEGAIDASNILKPALARGELRMIGATTPDEYRTHIEKDAAFERRFQPVFLEEPTEAQARDILHGLRERYETHHGICISDSAIDSAIELSARYIHDRFLPDKAIDLIDEASAKLKLSSQLDKPHVNTLQLAECQEEAIRSGDFSSAARIGALRRENASRSSTLLAEPPSSITLKSEHIASLISEQTGIPEENLLCTELQRLGTLEARLSEKIIGQEKAISVIASAIRRGRSGLSETSRPIGSFLFLGSTGVGKTELCRVIADALFLGSDSLIKLDMSEYMEKHSISKLIGSPPGYVGYGEGGMLTEKIRRHPYSVVLFDEIEKAHPDIFNLLLQILEDGHLTDSMGRQVDFSSTVIVMTSNLLSTSDIQRTKLGFREQNLISEDARTNKKLGEYFSPELLGRIDEIVIFSSLGKHELSLIAARKLSELFDRAENVGFKIEASDDVYSLIAKKALASDPHGGARAVRRCITELVEDPLARFITDGSISRGDGVHIGTADDEIIWSFLR